MQWRKNVKQADALLQAFLSEIGSLQIPDNLQGTLVGRSSNETLANKENARMIFPLLKETEISKGTIRGTRYFVFLHFSRIQFSGNK